MVYTIVSPEKNAYFWERLNVFLLKLNSGKNKSFGIIDSL